MPTPFDSPVPAASAFTTAAAAAAAAAASARVFLAAATTATLTFLATTPSAAVDILASAASGRPYGVAAVELPLEFPVPGAVPAGLELTDPEGRILYRVRRDRREPVPQRRPDRPQRGGIGGGRLLNRVGNLIRDLADTRADDQATEQTVSQRVFFLFRGTAPLDVTVARNGQTLGTYRLTATADPGLRADLLSQWWAAYTGRAKTQIDAAGYPPLVETYLVAMLSGRTGMPLPAWYTASAAADADPLLENLKLLGGAADQKMSIFRKRAAGDALPPGKTDMPLPQSPAWAAGLPPRGPNAPVVPTEPLAGRVPPDCFYLRYGSFTNFLWFKDLSAEYGGDISAMATVKGIADNAMGRVESQLQMKTTEVSRLLGPSVIDDQAIIGRDLFMADGASIGVLIKAQNAFLLRTSLSRERAGIAAADATITLETLEIEGHSATFLHSADDRVRSILVEDDSFFLVTNSRAIAREFLRTGRTNDSLAATAEFQLARELMPLDRDDSLFVYISPAMLRGLVAPDYLIELRRRIAAKSEISLVHIARLVARNESGGKAPPAGIDELKAAGFLPATFGRTPDGSGVVAVGDDVMDTRRGAAGTFLPIADSPVTRVNSAETQWYREIAAVYSSRLQSVSPIMLGIQRERITGKNAASAERSDDRDVSNDVSASGGIERITIHAEAAPWDPTQHGWYSQQLGPPTNVAIQFAPDDIIAVQAHVASDRLGPPTHLFAAIKDTIPPDPRDVSGVLGTFFAVRGVPGYLGAWPQPGALDRLPLGLGRGQPVAPGLSRLIGGLYRYTGGGFSVLSFNPDLLGDSLQNMAAVEVPDSAQLRLHVGNLYGSQLEDWVNTQLYQMAAKPSAAGAEFLDQLSVQMGVEPAQAAAVARRILGGELQCPLGGNYQFNKVARRWTSTAWLNAVAPPASPPPTYVAPLMTWFRGGSANVTQYPDRIVADVQIEVQRTPR